jgi:hypothetical protein
VKHMETLNDVMLKADLYWTSHFMDDDEIAEEQRSDELFIIDQIRRCGTLFYESELPSPKFTPVTFDHQRRPLPEEVIPEAYKPLNKVDEIFHRLQECKQLPSLQRCSICSEDVGVLFNYRPTPLRVSSDYTCEQCREYMQIGIIMIEIKDGEDPNNRGVGWCVVNEACIRHIFRDAPEMMNKVLKDRGVFVTSTDWTRLYLPRYGNFIPEGYRPLIEE